MLLMVVPSVTKALSALVIATDTFVAGAPLPDEVDEEDPLEDPLPHAASETRNVAETTERMSLAF
jgi:hypothetical protein